MSTDKENKFINKYFVFLFFSILLLIILWSVVNETLLPLYRNKEYDEFLYNVFGIPIILLGISIFAKGGLIICRNTIKLFDDPQLFNNYEIIRDKMAIKEDIKMARTENTKMLFSTWRKGSFLLLIGSLLIICGGLIINLKKIIG